MKKVIMAVACLIATIFTSFTAQAQLENVAASKDSSIVITSVYAGMLATTSYLTDRNKESFSNNFRVGGSATWKLAKTLQLKSWAIFDMTVTRDTSTNFSLQAFWLQWQPNKKWQLQVGKGATLSAQQYRPLPASNSGQFETWTQSRFPGLAPVVNIKYTPRKGVMFGAGLSSRNNQPEYQLAATFGQFKLSGFYQDMNKSFGAGVSYASKNGVVTNTTLWKQNQIAANVINIFLDKKQTWLFYNDFGYDLKKHVVPRCETGILKIFAMKHCKGLVGLGYQYESKGINGYLYLTL